MKFLFTKDVQLNVPNNENLSAESFHKWQNSRMDKVAEMFEKARMQGARNVFLFGTLFGGTVVPEKTADGFFDILKENRDLNVYAFLSLAEYQLISYRNDIPANYHMFCMQGSETLAQDPFTVWVDKGHAEIEIETAKAVITETEEERFEINGNIIPSFEPSSFEDARENNFGYLLWITEQGTEEYKLIRDQKYNFQTAELKIVKEDTEKDILERINEISRKAGFDTFLRITITGKTAFGLMINTNALTNKLEKRQFSVQVFDNSVMDVNEAMFADDISLRSEFVKLALADDYLSEGERNRIISMGWNALHGKEMAEE